jgi:hypothetical protein
VATLDHSFALEQLKVQTFRHVFEPGTSQSSQKPYVMMTVPNKFLYQIKSKRQNVKIINLAQIIIEKRSIMLHIYHHPPIPDNKVNGKK